MSVDIANVPPSGTFGWVDPVHTVQPNDTVSFIEVTDPSEADTEAGFTYYYQVDDSPYLNSDAPGFILENLEPGTTHTIHAYIEDKDGGQSPVYAQTVHVQGDVEFANEGKGAVQLTWEAVRSFPLQAIDRGLSAAAEQAKKLLGLNGHPEYVGLVGPVVQFYIGDEPHRIWTVATSSGATMLMASNPAPVPNPDNVPQRAQLVQQGQMTAAAAAAAAQAQPPNLPRAQQLNTQIGTDELSVAATLGATPNPLWQEVKITGNPQQPGEGFEYAQAGQEFRNGKPKGADLRKGSLNLASLKYDDPQYPRYPREPGNQIGFIPAYGNPTVKKNHGEQRLLDTFATSIHAQPMAKLQELFTERLPCSGTDTSCGVVITTRVPQRFGMTITFKLYYMVPWVSGDKENQARTRLKDGYAALNLPRNG